MKKMKRTYLQPDLYVVTSLDAKDFIALSTHDETVGDDDGGWVKEETSWEVEDHNVWDKVWGDE